MPDSDAGAGPVAEGEDELVITRTFAAPHELVWRAWTEPERLARWWGPKGSAVEVVSFDLRPGGLFLYRLRAPDGAELWGKFVYRAIEAPERLSFVSSFADPRGETVRAPFNPAWPLEILNHLTLQEQGGQTALTLRGGPINASPDERRSFREWRDSVQEGFAGTFDQLSDYLAGG